MYIEWLNEWFSVKILIFLALSSISRQYFEWYVYSQKN